MITLDGCYDIDIGYERYDIGRRRYVKKEGNSIDPISNFPDFVDFRIFYVFLKYFQNSVSFCSKFYDCIDIGRVVYRKLIVNYRLKIEG